MKIMNATTMAIGLVLGSGYGTVMASDISTIGKAAASAIVLAVMGVASSVCERHFKIGQVA